MLGEKELHELGILNWSALAGNFNMADLLLGNGFSVNITSRLDYNSLFDEFLKRGSSKEARIFESFGTNNFELILEKLLNAKDVNEIFKIDTSGIEDSIECLKVGLIKTIEAVHPRWAEADHEKLQQIAMQLNRFNDVFTLNYDLYLYRIILVLKDKYRHGENVGQYSDYFWDHYDKQFLCFESSKEFEGYRHPYYLHGALFLFKESLYELKLRKADSPEELIEVISTTIREGRIPLFVSEGTHRQKEEAISRSEYLRFALERLRQSQRNLVIFGTSLSDPDRHIIDAINQNERDLAVSIHLGTKSRDEVESTKYSIKSKFPEHRIKFFNSQALFSF